MVVGFRSVFAAIPSIDIEMEDNMENLVALGQFFVGLGIFFLGIASLWWVSVYSEKKKK
jgi:hypothetical protein